LAALGAAGVGPQHGGVGGAVTVSFIVAVGEDRVQFGDPRPRGLDQGEDLNARRRAQLLAQVDDLDVPVVVDRRLEFPGGKVTGAGRDIIERGFRADEEGPGG
jgi:hypothetical protein